MKKETKITSAGIRKVLKNYNPPTAFAEYIWNGFDATATEIDIFYEANELGRIDLISITDNGTGINLEKLAYKFDKFYDSEKAVAIEIKSPKHTSVMHGKNGVGRLTFFAFANNAEWKTTYLDEGGILKGGIITIDSSSLQSYNPIASDFHGDATGTIVSFVNFVISSHDFEQSIMPYLRKEFGWFLELNQNKVIRVNGIDLDYEELITDKDSEIYEHDGSVFQVNYIQWKDLLNKEQSKFYYLDGWGREVYKDFTTLNRKGDTFYHSVYIQSDFFDDFIGINKTDNASGLLFGKNESQKTFKKLNYDLTSLLRSKKRPLLRKYGEGLVEQFEKSGILPDYNNPWEKYRVMELKEVIVGLYEVQPKIFIDLNVVQKKTFVKFLNLLLDSNERDKIFEILNDITALSPDEMQDLAALLKSTRLNRIISTIKLIEDRYKAVEHLKYLVLDKELNASELVHLQSFIENHYWIFGEQYNLVTSAEPAFDEALRRHMKILHKEYDDKEIEHPDRLMQMDIFMCRQECQVDRVHNVVVELKHPRIKLGDTQLNQVKKYMNVISNEPRFNASNMTWEFILIGNSFNKHREIELAIQNVKHLGERSLVFAADNYKIYVKTWSDIFNEFRLKHDFIDEKLKLEKLSLVAKGENADSVLAAALDNSAKGEGEFRD